MNKDSSYKGTLIQYRLEEAKEALRDARMLYEQNGAPRSVVNRAYYAMFYAALALLVTADRHAVKHSGVIALFDKEFVRQNIVSEEMGRMLHQAFESRLEGDYRDNSKVDHKMATKVLESADEFDKVIEQKLQQP